MSLTQKMVAMNVATKNLTITQLAEALGVSRSRAHRRLTSPSFLYKFLEYCDLLGFQLVARNEQGTIIPFTYQDALNDVSKRKSKRERKK